MASLIRRFILYVSAGNKTFADKFSDEKPNAAYLQLPRAERADTPYVNIFQVVNKDDVVPKVNAQAHALHQSSHVYMQSRTYTGDFMSILKWIRLEAHLHGAENCRQSFRGIPCIAGMRMPCAEHVLCCKAAATAESCQIRNMHDP